MTEIDRQAEFDLPDELLKKYNRPGPRYTSYPPAPAWNDDFSRADLERAFPQADAAGSDVSLYVHIPFCESLCLFCACNAVIQKDHLPAADYLESLRREIAALQANVVLCLRAGFEANCATNNKRDGCDFRFANALGGTYCGARSAA